MHPNTFDKMTHPMPINICRSYLSSNFNANKDVWGIHKPRGQLRGGGFDKRPFYNRSLFNKSEPEGGREVKNTQNFDHVVYDNPRQDRGAIVLLSFATEFQNNRSM